MMEISLGFMVAAFVAGVLMFLAPCTLPLIPAYLAFISGVDEVKGRAGGATRRRLLTSSLAFVLGFSLIFISFGMLAGFFGSFIGPFRLLLMQIGGVFLIVFGLGMLGLLRVPWFSGGGSLPLPRSLQPGNPISASLIGATFALGWTPCVGPVLASVLLLATSSSTALSGGVMLAIFSLGLAVPFLLTAVLYDRVRDLIASSYTTIKAINVVGGIFLILIGGILMTDNFGLLLQYGYVIFGYFGFDALFNHF